MLFDEDQSCFIILMHGHWFSKWHPHLVLDLMLFIFFKYYQMYTHKMVKYRHHSSGNQLLIEIIYSMFCLQWGFTATIFFPVGYPIDIIVKNKHLKKLFLPTAIRIFWQNFRICNVSSIGRQYIGAFCYSFHYWFFVGFPYFIHCRISLWSTL